MVLDNIRDRVTKLFRSNDSQPSDRSRSTAQKSKSTRSDSVALLQDEVRRLQHEITELSNGEVSKLDGAGREIDSEQMAILHRQLKEKQTELARYQARI